MRIVAAISDQHGSEWTAMGEVVRLLGSARPKRCASGFARPRSMFGSRPSTTTEESAGLKLLRRETAALRGAAIFEDSVSFLHG